MRFLHTGDWHLGRTLHQVDMLPYQSAYLDHLVELATEERVDAVLVSGDVYDRAVPSVEAVALLSDALRRLGDVATVILISGNHDSATRLGFGADLLRDTVRIRTGMSRVGEPVLLGDDDGGLAVYPIPYLDPDAAREVLAPTPDDPLARSHEAVLTEAMARIRAHAASTPLRRTVVMAHAFVTGGEPSESERDIRVGGVDAAPAGVFAGVDYVALGHLHSPQQLDHAGTPIVYPGSPLAYSFSEKNRPKRTMLVDLGRGHARVSRIPAPVPRRLSEVSGTMEQLEGALGEPHVEDWVKVTITDSHRPEHLHARVKARFPHALAYAHIPPLAEADLFTAVTSGQDPLSVAADFVDFATGKPATPAETSVLAAALEAVNAKERSA